MGEIHGEGVRAAFPRRVLGAWDLAVPLEHIGRAVRILERLGDEAEGMVAAPLLAFLLEAVDHQLVYLLLLHKLYYDLNIFWNLRGGTGIRLGDNHKTTTFLKHEVQHTFDRHPHSRYENLFHALCGHVLPSMYGHLSSNSIVLRAVSDIIGALLRSLLTLDYPLRRYILRTTKSFGT